VAKRCEDIRVGRWREIPRCARRVAAQAVEKAQALDAKRRELSGSGHGANDLLPGTRRPFSSTMSGATRLAGIACTIAPGGIWFRMMRSLSKSNPCQIMGRIGIWLGTRMI